MKILHLTLKKKWFDMIASGEKKEEYREIKPYWETQFRLYRGQLLSKSRWENFWKDTYSLDIESRLSYSNFDAIEFKNGYSKDAPKMIVEFEGIEIGKAKSEWSDNWQGEVFIIKLGEIITKPQNFK